MTLGEYGVYVTDERQYEWIKDDNNRLTMVHDTGCFRITPIETHISGHSPRQGMSDEEWDNR